MKGKDRKGQIRVRQNKYRIVYYILEEEKMIEMENVDIKKSVYKRNK